MIQFGISNFSAAQIKEIHAISTARNYVLPTVYQGSNSLLLRSVESSLLPTLRSLDISFHGYAPLAGGFLSSTPSLISHPLSGGRWDTGNWVGKLYQSKYNRPGFIEYLEEFIELTKESGIGQAEIAGRWVRWHRVLDGGRGDKIIVGSRKAEQLEGTLVGMERGPLVEGVVQRLEKMWEKIEERSPGHEYVLAHFS